MKSTSSGEFGGRIDDARDDHGDHEITLAARGWVEDGIESEFAKGAEDCGDVTVRLGAEDVKGFGQGIGGGAALEDMTQRLDLVRGPVGEVGEGAIFDFAIEAEGFAEEDGGRGAAVGDGCHVHVYIILYYLIYCKIIIVTT